MVKQTPFLMGNNVDQMSPKPAGESMPRRKRELLISQPPKRLIRVEPGPCERRNEPDWQLREYPAFA